MGWHWLWSYCSVCRTALECTRQREECKNWWIVWMVAKTTTDRWSMNCLSHHCRSVGSWLLQVIVTKKTVLVFSEQCIYLHPGFSSSVFPGIDNGFFKVCRINWNDNWPGSSGESRIPYQTFVRRRITRWVALLLTITGTNAHLQCSKRSHFLFRMQRKYGRTSAQDSTRAEQSKNNFSRMSIEFWIFFFRWNSVLLFRSVKSRLLSLILLIYNINY